ncbi:hypothetical protein [Hufsiella ginkgonis]|uniref:Uncharacterized protein n=1 Tax=Hufsiella ginkgonis TaxID=2695274 RepID=A0A7K1XVH1_9SPHI|nr:hypothetical protein [Hufsiella ginkgonis]MXV14993.1 hypothetical protein [Hufsiella ginkgonis]
MNEPYHAFLRKFPAITCVLFTLLCGTSFAQGVSLAGIWEGTLTHGIHPVTMTLYLEQGADKVSGTMRLMTGEAKQVVVYTIKATVTGGKIVMTDLEVNNELNATPLLKSKKVYTGTVNSNKDSTYIKGTWAAQAQSGPFTLRRTSLGTPGQPVTPGAGKLSAGEPVIPKQPVASAPVPVPKGTVAPPKNDTPVNAGNVKPAPSKPAGRALRLMVTEAGLADGDRISVYFNGVLMADNVLLTRNAIYIDVPYVPGKLNKLEIESKSSGKDDRSTVLLSFYDKTRHQHHQIRADCRADQRRSLSMIIY